VTQFLKFVPELKVIVDFAIEYQGHIAVVRKNGLVAGIQIEDLEPGRAQRGTAGTEDALPVRPSMSEGCSGALDAIRLWYPIFMSEPNYSTQDA
jgi:hypothetical protein